MAGSAATAADVGAHAGLRCRLGQAGPDRLANRSMKSGLILQFTEHSLQPSCPAHRHMPRRRLLGQGISGQFGRWGEPDRSPISRIFISHSGDPFRCLLWLGHRPRPETGYCGAHAQHDLHRPGAAACRIGKHARVLVRYRSTYLSECLPRADRSLSDLSDRHRPPSALCSTPLFDHALGVPHGGDGMACSRQTGLGVHHASCG